jgi:dihydroxyacetone kinase
VVRTGWRDFGALWGAGLSAIAASLANREAYTADNLVAAVAAARDAIIVLGGASPGDKTMVDALVPLVDTLAEAVNRRMTVPRAVRAAAEAATGAARATAPPRPRKGRARPLADKSVGRPDPGAVSLVLIATAFAEHLLPGAPVQAEGLAGQEAGATEER